MGLGSLCPGGGLFVSLGVLFWRDACSPWSWCPALGLGAGCFGAGGGVCGASVALLPRVWVGRGGRVAAHGALVFAFGGAVDCRAGRVGGWRVLVVVGARDGGAAVVCLGSRFRFWGCGLSVLGRWSRSSRRRSFWRVCSRPGIRRGWRGSLALVAGGRFPARVVLVLSWRRCFTAPGGSWMRSCSAMRVRGGPRWFASRRRLDLQTRWLRGWRRWPRVGRAAALPGSSLSAARDRHPFAGGGVLRAGQVRRSGQATVSGWATPGHIDQQILTGGGCRVVHAGRCCGSARDAVARSRDIS